MDGFILEFFQGLDWWGQILLLLLELICAGVFAGFIGYERVVNGHAAGLRTHILVSIGACLIMNLSISAPGLDIGATRDPARIAAQVVSGIGFLGAGTIIQNGTNVKGLTTAATIWLCGGVGLACGSGYFIGALLTTIISYITLTLLTKMEANIIKNTPRIVLLVEYSPNISKEILELAKVFALEVSDIHSTLIEEGKDTQKMRLTIKMAPASKDIINAFADDLKYRLNPSEFNLYNR